MDDDCVPGERFVELAIHAENTGFYKGILGGKGLAVGKEGFQAFDRRFS